MIFNSIEFIILFFTTLLIFSIVKEKHKILLFFIVSSIFYSYLYAPYLFILYFIIIVDFYFSSFIYKAKSKNIYSSFFIPPISKKSLNYFKNNREIDLNITIGDTLSLFFLQRNIPFYDFTEIAGENDEKYFYDAIHFDKKFANLIFKIVNE